MAKIIYSLVLISLLGGLVYEFYRIWFDRSVYIGDFQYFDSSGAKPAKGTAFTLLLDDQFRALNRRIANNYVESDLEEETLLDDIKPEPTSPDIARAVSGLDGLELKLQGLDFGKILHTLRRWVSTPSEITGVIQKEDSGFSVTISLPDSLAPAGEQSVTLPLHSSELLASRMTACAILWANVKNDHPQEDPMTRINYCKWINAWSHYVDYQSSLSSLDPSAPNKSKGLIQALSWVNQIRAEYKDQNWELLPRIPALKYAILDTLPKNKRKDTHKNDLNEALTEWQISRKVDLKTLERLKLNPDSNLAESLGPLDSNFYMSIKNIDPRYTDMFKGTGFTLENINSLVAVNTERGSASGFVIGPDKILSVSMLITDQQDIDDLTVMFLDGRISKVIKMQADNSQIRGGLILLTLPPGTVTNQALSLTPNKQIGDITILSYVFFNNSDLPKEDGPIVKIIPGRLRDISQPELLYDALTNPGSAGSPIIDMNSGHVIGVHVGGQFADSHDFKRGFGTPITKEVLEWINNN